MTYLYMKEEQVAIAGLSWEIEECVKSIILTNFKLFMPQE